MSAHHQMNEHSEAERGESQGRGARGRGGRGGCGRQLGGVSNTGEEWPGSSLRSRCRRLWWKWFFVWYTAPSFRRFRWSCLVSLEEWECILPGYSTFYSVVFRVAIPFLLASIVFHQDWIKGNFPENHHLFYSRLFTSGIVQRLRSKVETGIFKNE